jgi:hypothetical protein
MILEPELIEQALLHHQTLAHHGPILLPRMPHQGITIRRRSRGLFQRNRHSPDQRAWSALAEKLTFIERSERENSTNCSSAAATPFGETGLNEAP